MAAAQPSLALRFLSIRLSCTRHPHVSPKPKRLSRLSPSLAQSTFSGGRRSKYGLHLQVMCAVEEGQDEKLNSSSAENESETKEALKGEEGGDGLWSGVAEEIREIEWPAFGKVVGTTVVVLGVIAGSSVVLLTVNVVLAELSDRVFAGRGVQDFFG